MSPYETIVFVPKAIREELGALLMTGGYQAFSRVSKARGHKGAGRASVCSSGLRRPNQVGSKHIHSPSTLTCTLMCLSTPTNAEFIKGRGRRMKGRKVKTDLKTEMKPTTPEKDVRITALDYKPIVSEGKSKLRGIRQTGSEL